MGIMSFYSMRKPRRFDHRPIYFDPRKEALDERVRKVEVEMGVREEDTEEYKPSIKGSFVEGTHHLRKSREKGDTNRTRESKNIRLVIIIAVLAFLYWLFYLK